MVPSINDYPTGPHIVARKGRRGPTFFEKTMASEILSIKRI
jgi:hypothetical protein